MRDFTPQPSWGTPFTADEFGTACALINCTRRDLATVIGVETENVDFMGFHASGPLKRLPVLVYERQWFHRLTKGKFTGVAPASISHAKGLGAGKYGTFAAQYDKLHQARAYDEAAAYQACSWGLGQTLGLHYQAKFGYTDIETFVTDMCESEGKQLQAMANFIVHTPGCAAALRAHQWAGFARAYNGANFRKFLYDDKLAAQYARLEGGVPDIAVRTAQVYLRYAGHDPGPIDGMLGTRTKTALTRALPDHAPPPMLDRTWIDAEVLAALRTLAGFPPPSPPAIAPVLLDSVAALRRTMNVALGLAETLRLALIDITARLEALEQAARR